jgi:hypothetical protein
MGGFFSASMNRIPKVDSFFFIAFYDAPKLRKLMEY